MNPKTPYEALRKFQLIKTKIEEKKPLTPNEEEMLGLMTLMQNRDIHNLNEETFSNYKFHHLYLIYSADLSFSSEYFQPNFDIKFSKIFDSSKIREINRAEFNQETFNKVQQSRREFNVEKPKTQIEIARDKIYLEDIAKKWALEMLNGNHTDQKLVLLSKETRDTIKKSAIEEFLSGSVSAEKRLDVLKALLKSKHIHIEALKLLEEIGKNELIFKLGEIPVHYNYGSLIHILNAHYAQLSSNELISNSKTFHLPQIDPRKLHHILSYIFRKINAKKNLVGVIKPAVPIYIKYKNVHYAIYLKVDNLNKTKINLRTIYQIDENNPNGEKDMQKIKAGKFIPLSNNLGIYKTSANRL